MYVARPARRFAVLGVGLLAWGALSGSIAAQEWRGTGRASGSVRDTAGEPISGAAVVMRWALDPESGPPAVTTNRKGSWAVLGLVPGRWLLSVEADGFRQSQGSVEVRLGATPRLEVVLRPLVIQTPTSSEGQLESVRTWVETGNSLLAAGEWEAARVEYAKVLAEVDGPARADVLRSVARTHYMEGATEAAVEALEQAVLAAPGEATTEGLYRSLMEGEGRTEEAETYLAGVADGSIAAPQREVVEAVAGERMSATGRSTVVEVEAFHGRTGAYTTAFDEHHPLAAIDTFSERLRRPPEVIARTDPAAGRYDLAAESFEIFAPRDYADSSSWGLFVWVSPTPAGRVPTPGAQAALRENKLIWVGANNSGNERLTWNRLGLALDAAHNAVRYYDIDPERVYVGGYSGGGRIATALTLFYPEVFRGGLFVYGVDFFRRVGMPDRPGSDWVPWFPVPGRAELQQLRESRLVLLTGEKDFNRLQTQVFAEKYEQEGFRHVTYIEIPDTGHYDWPPRKWLTEALAALDPVREE